MKFFPRTNDLFDTVFDDMFTSPIFNARNDMVMKTDITEKDGNYMLDMELPGCRKEDIHLELNDGYLNVSASRNTNKEEKDDKGNLIRQERYSGSFSRSFYVGEHITEADIHPKYENGLLSFFVPQAQEQAVEEKKHYISIEG